MVYSTVLPGCISLVLILISAECASITKYDQSQHGTYNVQIHLKNLEVIAILDDSMLGGDTQGDIYDYDYTDVSAAFANSTTTTTTTSTPSPNSSSSSPDSSPYPSSSSSSSTAPASYASSSKPSSTPSSLPLSSLTTSAILSTTPGTTPSANKTTNRLTTIINTKATPRPGLGSGGKTNATAAATGGKPASSTGASSNKYNASNALHVVLPASPVTSATKPPHNKIVEASTPQPATTAGTTAVTALGDGLDYTLMDTISIPVEVQQPPAPSMPAMMIRKCAPGYFRDSNGKCRRIRKPHLPLIYRFLQMVHTPGVIKSFQGAESSTKKMSAPVVAAHAKIPKDERLVLDLAAKMAKEDLSNVKIK